MTISRYVLQGEVRPFKAKACQCKARQAKTGQVRTGQGKLSQGKSFSFFYLTSVHNMVTLDIS